MENDCIITFGEYRIRAIRRTDESTMARHANNHEISRYLRDLFPHPYSVKDARTFITRALSKNPREEYAIASETELIGCIGLIPQTDVNRLTAEIGYWLGQPYQNRGIMSQAVRLFSGYVFENYHVIRLYATVFSNNPASMRVLEKAGYSCEGIMKAGVIKEGRILDAHLYAKVKELMD